MQRRENEVEETTLKIVKDMAMDDVEKSDKWLGVFLFIPGEERFSQSAELGE